MGTRRSADLLVDRTNQHRLALEGMTKAYAACWGVGDTLSQAARPARRALHRVRVRGATSALRSTQSLIRESCSEEHAASV